MQGPKFEMAGGANLFAEKFTAPALTTLWALLWLGKPIVYFLITSGNSFKNLRAWARSSVEFQFGRESSVIK